MMMEADTEIYQISANFKKKDYVLIKKIAPFRIVPSAS